jgi:hypothetical protein
MTDSSVDSNHRFAFANLANEAGFYARARGSLAYGRDRFRVNDQHHANAHVEDAVHFLVTDAPAVLQQLEDR